MKKPAIRHPASRLARGAVFALASLAAGLVSAAQTDISSTPIVATTAAAVKPNIMLLMDASTSMSYTHMPDQVESVTGIDSIGYKSWQCNTLYYDPNKTYILPKEATGLFFAGWTGGTPLYNFGNARAKGFGHHFTTPDISTLNLATQFRAYDLNSLETGGFQDTAQPAYYYLHSSGTALNYTSAECRTLDTNASKASDGTGNWTRVLVGSTSAVQQQNFAVWYSFYRDRIGLIKSAASLAFNPLTDTFRVGFITVQPKTLRTDPAINPDRYLRIADFDSTQRTGWYAKLFSQPARGTSPSREGLARVGRHYAGMEDGINAGMAATGANDPLQYSCQQNFTILTTDGYWNTQSETPTDGGPQTIAGNAKIGQADGDSTVAAEDCPLSNPYCPRPIYDGYSSSVRTDIAATNSWQQIGCGVSGQLGSWWTYMRGRSWYDQSFVQMPRRTETWNRTVDQDQATRYQTTKTLREARETREQYSITTQQYREERYQIRMSQRQTTRTTRQQVETSIQHLSRQYQVSRTTSTVRRVDTWFQKIRRQWQETRAQKFAEVRVFQRERLQSMKRVWRWTASPVEEENYQPVASCVAGPTVRCRIVEVAPFETPTPVAFGTCSAGQNSAFPYEITECTAGPLTQGVTNVASCTVGTTDAGAPNHVREICNDNLVSAAAPAPISCTNNTNSGNQQRTICTNPAGPNNQTDPPGNSANCTATNGLSSANSYVRTTCVYSINQVTYPDDNTPTDCTAGTESPGITVSCNTLIDNRPANLDVPTLASCGSEGLNIFANNYRRRCTTTVTGPTLVDPSTCPVGSRVVGTLYETCTRNAVGSPSFVAMPTDCVASPGTGPSWIATECDTPSGTNYSRGVLDGSCTISDRAVGPNYIGRTCDYPAGPNNNAPGVKVADGSCATNPGTSPPYINVACSTVQTMAPTLVAPGACTSVVGNGGPPEYLFTTCARTDLSNMVANCTAGNTGPPDFIQTDCGIVPNSYFVDTCVEGTTGPPWDQVTCTRTYTPNVLVASCFDQPKSAPNWLLVQCTFPTTFGPQIVQRSDCPFSEAASAGNGYQTRTCNRVVAVAAAPVPLGCTNQLDGPGPTYYETVCSKGPLFNATPQPVAPCTPGPTAGPDQSVETCTYTDVNDFTVADGFPGQCANENVVGRRVTCSAAVPTLVAGQVATCTAGPVGAGPATRRCSAQTVIPPVESATCTNGVMGNELISCSVETQVVAPFDDTSCVEGQIAGTRIKHCTSNPTPGYILRKITSRSTTTTAVSGSVPVGLPSVVTATVSTTDTACRPTTDPLVQLPVPNPAAAVFAEAGPVPGWCTTMPCNNTVIGPGGSRNSLADVASYYYKTDLRPGASWPNNVQPVGAGPEADTATHQHMTTFVVGLGVSGTLNYSPLYKNTAITTGDFPKIRCTSPPMATAGFGCTEWPIWPDPTIPIDAATGNYADVNLYASPKSIDDFWHTAVNGRGTYFSASDPTAVVAGLGDALNSIAISVASGAGDAASSLEPTLGNNFVFATSYVTGERTGGGWTGDLKSYTIDLTTGVLSATPAWSAFDKLNLRGRLACDNRNIYLVRMGAANNRVNFSWNSFACDGSGNPTGSADTGLDTTEQAFFDISEVASFDHYPAMTDGTAGTVDQRTAALGAPLVNFLRGQRGLEGFIANDLSRLYRRRSGILGDLVNSQPVYVAAPFARYQDAGYGAFITAQAARTPMVYVGGNDGMLHAFRAADGVEEWALIPQAVLPNLYKLADFFYKDKHQFYVDGSPVVGDVYDTAASRWRTVLVVGLNAGGKGYMAVDVTDPAVPVVLWEFRADATVCPLALTGAIGNTTDCNVGLTFGKPIITKVSGQWVVLVTSGYNNVNTASNGGDGGGFLYMINAANGQIVKKAATGAGNAATPSGLAQINNFVDNAFVDNTTVRAYGGDVLGNLYRFEFGATPAAIKLGVARDPGGAVQPVTTRPEIAEVDNKPMVFFGTGRLLGSSDVTDTQRQSVYAIIDPLTSTSPVFADLRTALRPVVITQTGSGPTAIRSTSCTDATACARTNGWYADFPSNTSEAGERVNVSMRLNFGTLIVASNVPEAASCTVGGHAWFNYFDFRSGAAPASFPLVDPMNPSLGNVLSQHVENSLIAGFNVYRLPGNNGPFVVGARLTSSGSRTFFPPPPVVPPSGKRISWREIVQ